MSYAAVFKSVGKYTTYFNEGAALPVLFWVRGVAQCPIPNQSVHYRTLPLEVWAYYQLLIVLARLLFQKGVEMNKYERYV